MGEEGAEPRGVVEGEDEGERGGGLAAGGVEREDAGPEGGRAEGGAELRERGGRGASRWRANGAGSLPTGRQRGERGRGHP